MKWRRLQQFSVEERTEVIPHIILCACILHNICIDAGDVDHEEAEARRSDEEREEELAGCPYAGESGSNCRGRWTDSC